MSSRLFETGLSADFIGSSSRPQRNSHCAVFRTEDGLPSQWRHFAWAVSAAIQFCCSAVLPLCRSIALHTIV